MRHGRLRTPPCRRRGAVPAAPRLSTYLRTRLSTCRRMPARAAARGLRCGARGRGHVRLRRPRPVTPPHPTRWACTSAASRGVAGRGSRVGSSLCPVSASPGSGAGPGMDAGCREGGRSEVLGRVTCCPGTCGPGPGSPGRGRVGTPDAGAGAVRSVSRVGRPLVSCLNLRAGWQPPGVNTGCRRGVSVPMPGAGSGAGARPRSPDPVRPAGGHRVPCRVLCGPVSGPGRPCVPLRFVACAALGGPVTGPGVNVGCCAGLSGRWPGTGRPCFGVVLVRRAVAPA